MTTSGELTTSTRIGTLSVKEDVMTEKKHNGEKRRKQGRPKVLPPDLDSRYQIRCSAKDVEAWEARAAQLGYVGASAWIRHVINVALKQPVR